MYVRAPHHRRFTTYQGHHFCSRATQTRSFLRTPHSPCKSSSSMRKTAPSSTSSKVRTLSQLVSVRHMLIYAYPGAQGCLSVVPETASIANRVFASFLAGLPSAHSHPPPATAPLDEALQRLAEIMHNPDIGNREPSSPMSFSCVPPVVAYRRLEIYARAAPGHRGAFSPLDPNGRPKRRCVSDPISS
jgi:hypothetical protein